MACKINEYISKLEKSLPDIHDRLDEKYMPEFDKLPAYKEGQRNLTVATVGSRETPSDILEKMTSIGKYLSDKGYTLQSGGAIGADMAFEGKSYPKTLTAKNEVKNKKGKVVLNAGETVKIGTKRFTDAYYVFNSKDNKGQIQASEWVKNTPTKNVTSFSSFDITQNKFGNADKAKTIANELHPSEEQLSTWPEALMARNTYQIFGKNLDKPVDFVLFYAEETDNPLRPKGGTGQAIEMARRKGIPTINMAEDGWRDKLIKLLKKQNSGKNKKRVPGININSYQKGLGYKLTNPTYDKSQGLYEITPSFELPNKPKGIANVEGWYKANNARVNGIPEGEKGDKYDVELMSKLIADKFNQYQELKKEVDEQGGKEFLENSTHNIHTKNTNAASRWENIGNGKGLFINALIKGYELSSLLTDAFLERKNLGETKQKSDTMTLREKKKHEEQMINKAVKEGC